MKVSRFLKFGTHTAALAEAIARTQPDVVIEFGCGHWSTPWLAGLARGGAFRLHTFESCPDWHSKFKFYAGPTVRIEQTDDPVEAAAYADFVGRRVLAFVDASPYQARVDILRHLHGWDNLDAAVIHDVPTVRPPTEQSVIDCMGMVGRFAHVLKLMERRPRTTIVSNHIDVEEWRPAE